AEQLLHRQAVGGLVEDRRQVVHPGHERRALGPGAELEVLLDAGVQVADDRPHLGDGLALQLQHQAQHPVGGRVLRPHVDDDGLLVDRVAPADALVPVAAGDGEDPTLRGLVAGCVAWTGHWYDLRWSGGGISAPWYSTGMPPSG